MEGNTLFPSTFRRGPTGPAPTATITDPKTSRPPHPPPGFPATPADVAAWRIAAARAKEDADAARPARVRDAARTEAVASAGRRSRGRLIRSAVAHALAARR